MKTSGAPFARVGGLAKNRSMDAGYKRGARFETVVVLGMALYTLAVLLFISGVAALALWR